MRVRLAALPFLVIVLGAASASAQVVREDGTGSIAGVLVSSPGQPTAAQWFFKSGGGEVLYASLSAHIYLSGSHHPEAAATAEGGGCEEEGGPDLFYLAVIGPDGAEICRAERPAPPPGWQRDPRMACVLPSARGGKATYTLRVGLLGTQAESSQVYPFLLDVSLRRIAPDGVHLQEAVAQSRNQF